MNFPHLLIFAKHDGQSKEYIFAVPAFMEVRKGDVLLVDTMKGPSIATATSEMFEGRNIDEVALKYGAYLPLKMVLQVAGKEVQQYIREKVERNLIERIKNNLGSYYGDDLPY